MTLTARGRGFVLVGASALGASVAMGSLVAGAIGLALVLAAGLAWVATRAPHGEAEREVSTNVTREGVTLEVTLRARFPRRATRIQDGVPAAFEITLGSAHGRGAQVELTYEAVPRAPGAHAFSDVVARFTDPLGLVEHVQRIAVATTVETYPLVEELRETGASSRRFLPTSGQHLVQQAGAGSDFFALRDYQPGDTMRDVNWRASARSGQKLVVNQREMESLADVTYFLDARAVAAMGTVAQNGWTQALRAFAALGTLNAKRRDRPHVLAYGGDDPRMLDARAGDASLVSVLQPLIALAPAGERGLRHAVDAVLPRLRPRSAAVLVSSFLDDATVVDGVAALRALDMRVVVLALDAPALLTLAGAPEEERTDAARSHEGTLDALRAQGATVVTWAPGEPLTLAIARGVA